MGEKEKGRSHWRKKKSEREKEKVLPEKEGERREWDITRDKENDKKRNRGERKGHRKE